MTFRASGVIAQDAYANLRRQVANSRFYLTNQKAVLQQPTSDAVVALAVIQHFSQVIPLMQGWAATPGIVQYAKDQVNDQAYDVVAEFNAMMTAMQNTLASLIAMFPKDGGGFLLYQKLNANGSFTNRTFTAAQLAPVVTLIDAVIATIS